MRHTKCCVLSYPTDFRILFSTTHLWTAELRLMAGANRLLSPVWIRSVCSFSLWIKDCLVSSVPFSMTTVLLLWYNENIYSGIYDTPALTMTSAACTREAPPQGFIMYEIRRNYKHRRAVQYSSNLDRSLILIYERKKMLTQHLYGTYKHGMQKHGTLMRILTGYVRYTFKRNI